MSWKAPTADDVLSEFTPAENESLNTLLKGGANVTARVTAILSRAVAEIRGYIRSGNYVVDSTSDSTLPVSLVTNAVAMTRWRLLISVPQFLQFQTKERKDAYDKSIAKLESIAAQKFVPDLPIPSPTVTTGMWNSESKIIMRTHPIPPPSTQFQQGLQTQPPYANPDAPSDQP